MSLTPDLENKKADIKKLAQKALYDNRFVDELLEGILSKKDVIRSNSFNTLMMLSEMDAERLYHKWNLFSELLDSENTYHKYIAVYLIVNLLSADKDKRFDEIFPRFYALLEDSIVVAGHVAALSARIIHARPELEPRITEKLLDIDKTSQKHKYLLKAGAIDSFDSYFEGAKDKEGILRFVRQALAGDSPKTRKKAKEFLKKWDKQDA
ncbi:hypothetical protein GX441_11010 [bacterium]|nr:hypothetical protein [bacterium]